MKLRDIKEKRELSVADFDVRDSRMLLGYGEFEMCVDVDLRHSGVPREAGLVLIKLSRLISLSKSNRSIPPVYEFITALAERASHVIYHGQVPPITDYFGENGHLAVSDELISYVNGIRIMSKDNDDPVPLKMVQGALRLMVEIENSL